MATATWNESGTYIVEVGRLAAQVQAMMDNHSISSIFNTLRIDSDATLCAIDANTGLIIGSTFPDDVGMNAEALGLDMERISHDSNFHGSVKPDISLGIGKGWLCIPAKIYTDLLDAWRSLQA